MIFFIETNLGFQQSVILNLYVIKIHPHLICNSKFLAIYRNLSSKSGFTVLEITAGASYIPLRAENYQAVSRWHFSLPNARVQPDYLPFGS